MKMEWRPRWVAVLGKRSLALVVCGLALAAPAAGQDMDPWGKGRQWISLRAGYAKSGAEGAADGNVGGGFGYRRFLSSKWAVGAVAELNLLGTFGGASEIESPWMIELSRHYRWPTVVRPFLGVGVGAYYHKFYRTGADAASLEPGFHAAGGAHASIGARSLLGFDLRMSVVSVELEGNPVFDTQPPGEKSNRAVHWSAKIDYAWAF